MLSGARNPVIVVAHPDDETLWAGGLLARFGPRCTVICCSIPSKDPIRSQKFKEAMRGVFQAQAMVIAVPDEGPDIPLPLDLLLYDHDAIVTHNSVGEYGHLHHRQVHQHIVKRFGGKVPIFTFGPRPNGHGAIELKLTPREEETRMRALQCYDHVLPYCGRPMPKWQALLERYGNLKPVETYDAHQP